MSITTRICLLFLLIVGSGSWFFLRAETEEIKKRYREATEEPLVDFATVLATIVARQTSTNLTLDEKLKMGLQQASWHAPSAQIYELNKSSTDIRVYIVDRSGKVVFDSRPNGEEGSDYSTWNDVSRTLKGEYGARMSYDPSGMMYVAAPIVKDNEIIGSLSVGKSTKSANLFIAAAKKSTMLLGLSTFLCVLIIGILLSFYVTHPIRALTKYVKRVSQGHKDPLPTLPSNEIATLAKEFEEMRTALDGRKYIENYVQTLTHEIKSPLSGIRAAAEILTEDPPAEAKEKFLGNILRESSRIETLVHNLLNLASLQNRPHLESREQLSLDELMKVVLADFSSMSEAKGVSLRYAPQPEIKLLVDRFWVSQALSHVLHNAIEFSPSQSEVVIESNQEVDSVCVSISDRGAGIPDFAKDKIFDKFYSLPRPGTNKKSSGLGLALVSEILKLHQGELRVDSKFGEGTVVSLRFPKI